MCDNKYRSVSYTHLDVYKRQIHSRLPANRQCATVKRYIDHHYKENITPVSYTHLDVYKRQALIRGCRLGMVAVAVALPADAVVPVAAPRLGQRLIFVQIQVVFRGIQRRVRPHKAGHTAPSRYGSG